MSEHPLTPWSEEAGPSPLEQRAAELLKAAGPAGPLPPPALEEAWEKLAPRLAAGVGAGLAWPWRKALLGLLGAGALALALALWPSGRAPVPPGGPPPPPSAAAPAQGAAPAPHAEPAALPPPSAVAPAQGAAPAPHAEPAPPLSAHQPPPLDEARRERAFVPSPSREDARGAEPWGPLPAARPPLGARPDAVPAAALEEDPLVAQARLLARAVDELRRQARGEVALATLDEFDLRFPQGALAREARLARIEALLATRRRPAALALLETTEFEGLPRATELAVVLGELLAEAGRCPEALGRFEQALAAQAPAELAERALWGRAACWDSSGDARAAQALERYLEAFPLGKFAPAAREKLSP